jgi:hypothetical protein
MGLDQYAYVAAKAGAYDEYYADENYEKDENDSTKLRKPTEIAYWRKHANLQGWMERLWVEKNPGHFYDDPNYIFNNIELELTWEDLDKLEADVKSGSLPKTTGFFFGHGADEIYKDYDLDLIKRAKAEVFLGLKVFYNSSW